MEVTFWGVRGSIPCPGPDTVKYGGNTACLELYLEEIDRRIIIDAGSGIRLLGNKLMAEQLPKGPIQADIFFTHTHWDHIMGFPFFTPVFIPGTKLNIYGPVTFENETLQDALNGQWTYRYFPVRHEELSSQINYIDLKEESLDLGQGLTLQTKYLNHPLLCLGYRFRFQGKVFCTAYDTEPFRNLFCSDPEDPAYDETMAREGEQVAREENERLERFIQGSDLLVYDTMYTQAELENGRQGWGHSSMEYAIESARRNDVKHLVLFHHDPGRTDAQLDELTETLCKPAQSDDFKVSFAIEGTTFQL